ncbi:MAG: SDR family oxidoreductase [Polyangiaceae bacterium]
MSSDDELRACLRLLGQVREAGPAHPAHAELERAVDAFYKTGKKQRRLERERGRAARDRARIEATGRVAQTNGGDSPGEYEKGRHCYVCKQPFRTVDGYHHWLCPECAATHRLARERRGELRGRHALVTGGRIKIGFELARMLLRDGAHVTLTTRFPRDAAQRFAALPEAHEFGERLSIVGLDLRYLPCVSDFCRSWLERERPLDILVNNAAQTVRRPHAYYRALAAAEQLALEAPSERSQQLWLRSEHANELTLFHQQCLADGAEHDAFPLGQFNEESLPLDLRSSNSWRLSLADVDAREMVEAHLVNAMAPFILMGQLRPALERSPFAARFVINVSAMEGKFDYAAKSSRHPHTNMAKAALNMLTRTSASDYAQAGIYVNSVDTGWVTDENPESTKQRSRSHGFYPPLDVVDGAARIYAPILDGLAGNPYFGLFLKDFRPTSW